MLTTQFPPKLSPRPTPGFTKKLNGQHNFLRWYVRQTEESNFETYFVDWTTQLIRAVGATVSSVAARGVRNARDYAWVKVPLRADTGRSQTARRTAQIDLKRELPIFDTGHFYPFNLR
jgi:hypothetical protein